MQKSNPIQTTTQIELEVSAVHTTTTGTAIYCSGILWATKFIESIDTATYGTHQYPKPGPRVHETHPDTCIATSTEDLSIITTSIITTPIDESGSRDRDRGRRRRHLSVDVMKRTLGEVNGAGVKQESFKLHNHNHSEKYDSKLQCKRIDIVLDL